MHQKKINIYIPIEIKKRELLSKIILSKFIIKNNKKKIRCYIGSKTQIKKIISLKKNYGGIYLYNGGLPYNQLEKIKKKIEKFIVLDEEIGPASTDSLERTITSRLWVGTEKYIDKYYVIGKYASDIVAKVWPKLSSKILVTGWPRVDLWRPEFSFIYNNSVESLRKQYGNFILFSSDFSLNSIKRINYELNYWKDSEWKTLSKNLDIDARGKKNFFEFQEFIKLISELDENIDIPQIIIRPHPSEDLLEWKKLGKSLKRIKIIFKGELTSWVYASSGVLHRGCTSAVEAHMAGIKTGYIVTNKEWIRKSLPYQVSEHLYNSNQIIEFCKSNISKKPLPPKEYIEAFKNTIRVEKIFACEIIAEDMIKFDLTSELPFNCNTIYNISDTLKVIFIKIKSFIIKLIKKLKDGVLLPDKIPGGITKKEITNIMDNFEIDHKLKIRQILIDCVEIEE